MIRANWDKVNAYFPHKYESDKFFLDYDYEKDVQGLQKAVEAGILPKELEKYKSVEDFVDDAKVIQYFDYDQTDIVGAINSGHEVMVRGPYYALRSNKFEQYIKKYLELTANGPIKSPPRVTKKKDDDVTNALGKESDGLEVGVQVKHKYEPIFGEIVNTFFTNDFVQVKNYDGNIMLVKKSNIEKLSPDDIPKYEKGDKVIINTQNTAMDYLHNKKAKVVSTNGLTITVSYGSYGDTVDLPIFFVKPGVKYSTDNPEVGDSVKVTKGEFAGEYGTIVHVSYYGKDIDVDFGDGESEAISQGYYEVVDPKTVPDNTDKQKFEIGDRVKVDSDGEKMSGYVGIVKKPGAVKTSVRIFGGTHVHPTQSIKNSRLNPVSEQDYEKQNFYHNAPVIAVSGKHRGKSGKVSYFMSNGNIEVTMDTGGYFETSIDNLVLVDKYTGKLDPNKGPKEKPEDPDKLKKGDTVLVLYGKHASKIGTINHIYLSGDTAEVRFDDDSYADIATSGLQKTDKSDDNIKDDDLIDLVDLDFEPLDEPTTATGQPKTDKGKFKVGDKVKITSGPEKGKTGEINYIYTYDNTAYIKSGDNYYDIALKDLEVDNGETDKEFDVNALNFMVGDEANATNPNAVKKLWTVDSIGSDHVILQNKSTGGTIKLPMEKFYASNPEYAPDANKFEDGDMVTVTTGPFKDFEGKVIGAGNEKDEKMLVINIFGKDNNVSIAKNYLKKISTPQTKVGQKATVLDPENKAELLELFKDKDIKVIMRKAIADKYISYDDQLDLSNASDLKYYTTLLPYLQLKGVKLL
jgi:transcription antitermination factor NusG